MKKIHNFHPVFDSQRMYRLLLDAYSNPGKHLKIRELGEKMYGEEPELLAVGMTILDNEVGFSTCGDPVLAQQLLSLTLSREESLEEADYVFVRDASVLQEAIGKVKCGTLKDPQKSATLFIRVCSVEDRGGNADVAMPCSGEAEPGITRITLSGPGIRDEETLVVPREVADALALRDGQYYEYPQGIDLVFITDDGELYALPRLVKEVR